MQPGKSQEMKTTASSWGHHGLFDGMGPDGPPPMPPLDVTRAPVRVMPGNFQRMHGVCPWWIRSRRATEPLTSPQRLPAA